MSATTTTDAVPSSPAAAPPPEDGGGFDGIAWPPRDHVDPRAFDLPLPPSIEGLSSTAGTGARYAPHPYYRIDFPPRPTAAGGGGGGREDAGGGAGDPWVLPPPPRRHVQQVDHGGGGSGSPGSPSRVVPRRSSCPDIRGWAAWDATIAEAREAAADDDAEESEFTTYDAIDGRGRRAPARVGILVHGCHLQV